MRTELSLSSEGTWMNLETLRELMISEVHPKGHHRTERNLHYASEYMYWLEKWKDFRYLVRQYALCQGNKEENSLPVRDAKTLPFRSEIFASYAIAFMSPLTKLNVQDSVVVVVDRDAGFCWLIPTSVTAIAVETTELLQHYIFTSHGVPTLIVSDANPRFTFQFWKQTLKTLGIEHIMVRPAISKRMGRLNARSGNSRLPCETSPTSAKPIGSPPSLNWQHILTLVTLILSICPYTKRCMDETTPS